jgi:uncharacterized membrane protein YgdD (TMEM256/DUF423 family)
MIQNKKLALWGAIFIFLSIALGALGAHALEKVLSPERLKSFLTANQYMSIHGLAFLVLALFPNFVRKPALLMGVGLLLFSGSIFLLVILGQKGIDIPKILALITPLGGITMIAAWLWLALGIFKFKSVS